jgi:hypothetical protein
VRVGSSALAVAAAATATALSAAAPAAHTRAEARAHKTHTKERTQQILNNIIHLMHTLGKVTLVSFLLLSKSLSVQSESCLYAISPVRLTRLSVCAAFLSLVASSCCLLPHKM